MNHKSTLFLFCGCFIVTLIIFVVYLWRTTLILQESQEQIVNEHIKHISTVDSIFYDLKTILLSDDSGKIENAPLLLAQLQNDSALMRREILLSQAEESNLVALHIDKIDNDYSQIGVWGGVLSIIFLIFGFFAIFKIEETKSEAKNILADVKEQKQKAKAEIKELQDQAGQLNNSYNSIRQSNENFIVNNTKVFNELITNMNKDYSQAQESLEKIKNLLVNVESKNEQYDASIKQVQDLMKQWATLINSINTTNNGKGTDHE